MVITKNRLVHHKQAGCTYRIVELINGDNIEKDDAVDYVVLIDVDAGKRTMPELMRASVLLEHLAARTFRYVEDTLPSVNLDALSHSERRSLEWRWDVLQKALTSRVNLYNPKARAGLARRFVEQKIATRAALYEILRLYWRHAAGKQSLLPRFSSCGAPGKERLAVSEDRKVGRRRTTQPGRGLAMTAEHRKKMSIALAKTPVGKDGRGMRNVYNYLLISQYPKYVTLDSKRSDAAPIIEIPDKVPTIEQLVYHWKTHLSFEERSRRRLRPAGFERLTRLLLSGTAGEVRGPGVRYYIDATVVDIYVVSRFNRNRIIGRPTLYLVVDEFSRLVVGLYIGLEPPCWVGAMLALWNCSLDKVEQCRKYGIEITPEMWPTGYMPTHLMGDRGELASGQAEALSRGFNLDVENAPPYRGDAKGVVERTFGTLQTRFGPYVPGYVDKEFLGRDADPPALSAAVDVDQLTKIFLASCLIHNHHTIRGYETSPEVVVEGTEFTPIALWHWGGRHLRCDSRPFSQEHLVRYLWPEAKLKLTRKGLQFYRGLWFMGKELSQEPWFLEALRDEQEFNVRFHPNELAELFLLPNAAKEGLFAAPVTRRSERLAQCSLSEFRALEKQKRQQNAAAAVANLPLEASMSQIISSTVAEARRMQRAERDASLSRAQRLRDIRQNRAEEIVRQSHDAVVAAHGNSVWTQTPVSPTADNSNVDEKIRQMVEGLIENKN